MAVLEYLGDNWINVNMMSRTHGQPAVTTSMGKEIKVFWSHFQTSKETCGRMDN